MKIFFAKGKKIFSRIKNILYYWAYRSRIHLGFVSWKRWKWRHFLKKGDIRTLEVGCGGGPWTIELLKRGNRVTALDFNEKAINRLRRRLDLFPVKKEKAELVVEDIQDFETNDRFDQIIIFEVLEHIKKDKEVVRKLTRMLRPGGRILISVPSDDYNLIYGDEISGANPGGHVRKGYSFQDLEKMFNNVGLKVVFKDSCAGFFTQKALGLKRYFLDNIANNLFLSIMLNLILGPLIFFDFLCRAYPDCTNFVIAQKQKT